jgi:acyl carrier protein
MGRAARMTLPDGRPATLAAITQDIIDLVNAEAHGDAESDAPRLGADSGLQDAGMDSAQVLSLVFRIEARYDIDLDAGDDDDLRTIGDLAQLVLRRIQERS